MSTPNIYDDTDPAFVYASSWNAGSWNASAVGQSGTLHSTNDPAANVTFTFPVAATGFSVFGIKRSHGGLYGICVDCNLDAPQFFPVDGFNATDNGRNPPVILYSRNFGTPGVHRVILRNQPDSRGTPPGNSQLALDRIELQLSPPPSTPLLSTPVPTPIVTLPPTITIIATTIASTSGSHITLNTSTHQQISIVTNASLSTVPLPINTTFPHISTSLSTSSMPVVTASNVQSPISPKKPTGTHIAPILGGVLGGMALIAGMFLMMSIIRVRAIPKDLRSVKNESTESPESTSAQTSIRDNSEESGLTPSDTASSAAQLTYGWGTAAAHIRHKYAHTSPLQENQGGLNSPNQSRRERDAGIVLGWGNNDAMESETLPPSYGDVFTEARNQRAHQFKCFDY